MATRINVIRKIQPKSNQHCKPEALKKTIFGHCLFSRASGLPDSGREQGQACQNTTRKDVDDHGQEILPVPGDGPFLGDFHTKSAAMRRHIGPPHSPLVQHQEAWRFCIPDLCGSSWDPLKRQVLFICFVCFSERKQMEKNQTWQGSGGIHHIISTLQNIVLLLKTVTDISVVIAIAYCAFKL